MPNPGPCRNAASMNGPACLIWKRRGPCACPWPNIAAGAFRQCGLSALILVWNGSGGSMRAA